MEPSALELINVAIDALMRADSARLERLAEGVTQVRLAASQQEQLDLAEKRLVLRQLLGLTGRNLRLLRTAGLRNEDYDAVRS